MKKNLIVLLFILSIVVKNAEAQVQHTSEYDQLVYVNAEWKNQPDVDPQLKLNAPKRLTEQELVQFHLTEVEKLLRKRDVSDLTPQLQRNRATLLDVLHQYLVAGVFPFNNRHKERQPYFIDDNNTYCAVGYLMKESGADDIARDIKRTQNYSFLADIHHDKLMNWVRHSGLKFDELALIQPDYGYSWPATVTEFHYNNTGPDVNEYIEIHQSSGALVGMIPFDTVRFYDGTGTLYKTLSILELPSFHAGTYHDFFYYVFPSSESFADEGRIVLSGKALSGDSSQTITSITYTANSVQIHDYYSFPGFSQDRSFGIGEDESSPVNLSLNFCDYYYGSWNLSAMVTTPGALNACLILPISLSDFSYSVNDKKVALSWETVSETNSKEFIVEKSLDGMNFEAIGRLPAAGNSNNLKRYSFNDNSPDYINYYRLKQMDIDGKFVYSKILYVKVEKASPLRLEQNIVITDLRYQLNAGMNGSMLEIYDMTGRKVYKTKTTGSAGQIDVSRWNAGKYLIRLQAINGQMYSHQFIKR